MAAMDDDLGVPAALAVLHETVSEGNRLLADRTSSDAELATLLRSVRGMLAIIGVDPLDPHWAGGSGSSDAAHVVLDLLVKERLAARQAARAERDFAAADAVRDSLRAAGVLIEDTPDGPRWSLEA